MLDILSGCTMPVVKVIRQLRGSYYLMQARAQGGGGGLQQ